jgi:hypothetical protein
VNLITEAYPGQAARWPKTGRHILAQYDEQAIIVYQAYNASIGYFAASHGYFGGSFSLERMSWIKPNFLWMMYRSGWGAKPDQEVILAVHLQRAAFDGLLKQAVYSTFVPALYGTEAAWKTALAQSPVRLQWDPDHHPSGPKLERRAIQLGLCGSALVHYAREWIMGIEDISPFVREQYQHVMARRYDLLLTPAEQVYPIQDTETFMKLGLFRKAG